MQMTEETFIWLRSKIAPDEDLTFDELYDPDVSIRFGCYYIHLCMERYSGDVATAAAAYHSGWGTVDNLLRMEEHSSDGQTLKGFPYNQMHHYVAMAVKTASNKCKKTERQERSYGRKNSEPAAG